MGKEIFYIETIQDGTFSEMGAKSGMAFSEHGEARAGMGIDAGVLDSTGNISVVVGNFSEEMVGVYTYVGNEAFIDRSASSRIGYPELTHSDVWGLAI